MLLSQNGLENKNGVIEPVWNDVGESECFYWTRIVTELARLNTKHNPDTDAIQLVAEPVESQSHSHLWVPGKH